MKLRIKSSNKTMMPAAATTTMFVKKKLRSKLPRRRRSHIAPFFDRKKTTLSFDSSSCYFDADEVSCDSSRVSNPKKRKFGESQRNEGIGDSEFRRITRSFSKENEVEMSESSCVESNSGADFRVFGESNAKVKKASNNIKEIEKNDAVSVSLDAVTRSDISCVDLIPREISKLSSENKENDLVSVTSGFEVSSTSKFDDTASASIKENVDANFTVSNSESLVDQKPVSFSGLDSPHLTCNEQFSLEEVVSDYSSSHETAFSELQSDLFPESSDLDFSDYTPSLFYDSGSQFSEKSTYDSSISLTYSIFHEFKEQFCRSTSLDSKFASRTEDERQLNPTVVRFDDEDDEESYKRLRERERRQVYLRDYAEEYRFTTDYGDLIVQQRSKMVRWIVEECSSKEIQQETMFLGVCLLDRFLSKGFFTTRNALQIVGIACLVLATRIEENQPYNR
ncbi:hypothetical protein COLO4_27611 [Corchorus olitorius]|uniref:Cyclin N-terminal domain-containing protein n=1 Tax=Corchorus olitorius TaxID=93759 RepID=A0A1R3HQG0_9ROSI|nr:hypothetical protein COLO4_27611 [Corchorus olitorius]